VFFITDDVELIVVSFSVVAPGTFLSFISFPFVRISCNQSTDGSTLFQRNNMRLNDTVPEGWSFAYTPYGSIDADYFEAGDKIDIYDTRKAAPCNDFKEGCEYELVVTLNRDNYQL
jgi:hypothetical protein